MAVIIEPTTHENHEETLPTPANVETTQTAQVAPDLVWLLAQAYVGAPLFA